MLESDRFHEKERKKGRKEVKRWGCMATCVRGAAGWVSLAVTREIHACVRQPPLQREEQSIGACVQRVSRTAGPGTWALEATRKDCAFLPRERGRHCRFLTEE